jgi:hypothetical protein
MNFVPFGAILLADFIRKLRQAKFAGFNYLEVKLCMLMPAKRAQDFSRRCALLLIACRFLATHPHAK